MPALTTHPVIEVANICRSFRSVKKEEGLRGALALLIKPTYSSHDALKGVSFSVDPGSFVGLIGANGAGKTTLLKILSGLIPPTSGQAKVLGIEPFSRPLNFRRQIALVMGQKAQLWWDLPAVDAFDLLRAIYEIPLKTYQERLNELATLLDVKRHLNTQIRRLSLGERMKMELIGALLHWPSVIFLDEPTIGLDVLAAHKLREFLRAFNHKEKATIILTSHNMDDIERLCSRVLIIRAGELIYDGKPQGLTRQGERRLKLRFLENLTIQDLATTTGLSCDVIRLGDEEAATFHFTVHQKQIVPILQSLMDRYEIIDMGVEEQSLERVIQKLYEEDRATVSSPPSPGTSS
ncbi:ATP-binding cassette domain-containing protein [Bdellovibrionota bacterium FG-1]